MIFMDVLSRKAWAEMVSQFSASYVKLHHDQLLLLNESDRNEAAFSLLKVRLKIFFYYSDKVINHAAALPALRSSG